eukprot:jgi/Psemu1/306804/fgenesh1_kg.282_\
MGELITEIYVADRGSFHFSIDRSIDTESGPFVPPVQRLHDRRSPKGRKVPIKFVAHVVAYLWGRIAGNRMDVIKFRLYIVVWCLDDGLMAP